MFEFWCFSVRYRSMVNLNLKNSRTNQGRSTKLKINPLAYHETKNRFLQCEMHNGRARIDLNFWHFSCSPSSSCWNSSLQHLQPPLHSLCTFFPDPPVYCLPLLLNPCWLHCGSFRFGLGANCMHESLDLIVWNVQRPRWWAQLHFGHFSLVVGREKKSGSKWIKIDFP